MRVVLLIPGGWSLFIPIPYILDRGRLKTKNTLYDNRRPLLLYILLNTFEFIERFEPLLYRIQWCRQFF